MPSDWQTWCRLCGKTEIENAHHKIGEVPNLFHVIQKHFAITVSFYLYSHDSHVCKCQRHQ